MRVVNRYIGVSGGYLVDFSYRTHSDFYSEYCGLKYEPNDMVGTTRERFMRILRDAPPHDQSRILRGVLERFPVGAEGAPPTRTQELADYIGSIATRIEGAAPVTTPDLRSATAAVEAAIEDAEVLMAARGPLSAVDRVHTALHGFLKAVAMEASIPFTKDASLTDLFGALRRDHPKLQATGGQAEHVTKLLKAMGALLDPLQPVRNRGSLAHPNEALMNAPEAMLVVNLTRTILRYVNDKLD